ncbi:MAG: hypothetical protein ACI81C_001499 [Alteromonas macleodii]|jgi:hypothetical protein
MDTWKSDSFVYVPNGENPLSRTHAQLPTPMNLGASVFRFFYSSRDEQGQSRPFYLDYDMATKKVLVEAERPVLELGAPGMFDDKGVMPSCVLRVGEEIYFYYIGWNQRTNISYQLAIGLAISKDNGVSFQKVSNGPVLDRNIHDPVFCAAPCVHYNGNGFTMWYISATGWPSYNGKPEPVYLIKRAISKDGIHWPTCESVCIPYKFEGEALGRPWVLQNSNGFHMWYSTRGSDCYREAAGQHYQIGYAYSQDGIAWRREDDRFSLLPSGNCWDQDMQEYSSVFAFENDYYMAYNGNTFGKTGFGIAKLQDKL